MIIYPQSNGSVALVSPTGEIAIEEVARKDVPADVPFLYVNSEDLPDLDFFEAWEADFSNPDGYGIGQDAWFAEQEAKKPPTPEPTSTVIKKATQ